MAVSKQKTFRNIVYSALTKGVAVGCAAISGSVVARNLPPSDYGVVGFAAIIIGFLTQFADLGLSNAAVQRPQIDRRSLGTVFNLKIVLSCGAVATTLLIAPFAHYFFEHPATANVIRLSALGFVISTIGFTPGIMLTREQNYRALMLPGTVGVVVRCLLVVVLISLGWKFWAVILADLGAKFANGIAVQLTRRVPITFDFDWPDAKQYLGFGLPLLGTGVLVFVLFNLDNFLVGASLGSRQLGYYALAFTWGSFICGLFYATVNNVMLPVFSSIQHDVAAVKRWYLGTVDLVAFVSVVGNTVLLANAHYFLVTFLGKGSNKWVPATLPLEILCIYGILRALTEPLAPVVMALGKTKALLRANVLAGVLEILLLVLVLRTGKIELVAVVVLFAYIAQAFVYVPFLHRDLGIQARDIAAPVWPVIPVVIVGYVATSFLPGSLGATLPTLAVRGLFTASVAALTHGLCTRFRCFYEAGGMIWKRFATAHA